MNLNFVVIVWPSLDLLSPCPRQRSVTTKDKVDNDWISRLKNRRSSNLIHRLPIWPKIIIIIIVLVVEHGSNEPQNEIIIKDLIRKHGAVCRVVFWLNRVLKSWLRTNSSWSTVDATPLLSTAAKVGPPMALSVIIIIANFTRTSSKDSSTHSQVVVGRTY